MASGTGMRRLFQLIVPVGIVAAGLLFNATASWAKPEYSRKTKKDCSFCHPSDSWKLTDAGRYYREHHYSLDGYKPPAK
jgi:hypothetical protein